MPVDAEFDRDVATANGLIVGVALGLLLLHLFGCLLYGVAS